jgi:LysR family transcriptional activator of nhaA
MRSTRRSPSASRGRRWSSSPTVIRGSFRFPRDIADVPFLLPGPHHAIRIAFDAICERLNVSVRILAEIDDMAMIRLLTRDTAVALLPAVVVRDELNSRVLRECGVVPGLYEEFYAITVERQYATRC